MSSLWDIHVENYSDLILATLRQIIRAIDLHSKNLAKKYGLTGPQLLVLKELHKDSSRTIGSVAKNISLSQATVTSILDRLEKQGFVTRVRQQADKRKVNLQLSERALDILAAHPSMLQEDFIRRFDTLEDWEKMLLISSLQRIASMMSAESIKSPPVLVSGPLDASHSDVKSFFETDETQYH
ncbi:MarR family winged helix-turn-helix transcriptional regulator [Salinispira pacifica]|uniref:Transcriptional regulator, MarR family n=1 Tax=Salinispira pacifica TaxID=1307761 RepID=V5WKJ6_9SPIO|nr:MarR family transcriptional regulator [Salinispira pacifica]AHC16165.1 Transcriptional regulator, MarR family [Salinispira pacifica]